MNIFKRELLSYRKQAFYWAIGILLLIFVSFYKVGGMNSTPGGMEAMLKALPPALRVFMGAGAVDYTTAVGNYSMIHSYLLIALALYAVILGAHIFAKEEQDKTFEFLYVKGVKRWKILSIKIVAGISILATIDLLCLLAIYISVFFMNIPFILIDIMPYILSLFITQLFFFSLALLLSLALKNAQKAGMIGCCIVLVMYMISMYTKLGGNIEFLDTFSLFHYADSNYIMGHRFGGISSLIIIVIFLMECGCSLILHERRNLLS